MRAAHLVMFQVLKRGLELVPDGSVMNETYVLSGLQIDDGQLPSLALCDEGEISTGFDLHGCPEGQRKVCASVEAKVRPSLFKKLKTCVQDDQMYPGA